MLERKDKEYKITLENHNTANETEYDIDFKDEPLENINTNSLYHELQIDKKEICPIKIEKEEISDDSETDTYVTLLFEDIDAKKPPVKKDIKDEDSKLKFESLPDIKKEESCTVPDPNDDELQADELIIKDEPGDIHEEVDLKYDPYFLEYAENNSKDTYDDEETETASEGEDEIDVVSIDETHSKILFPPRPSTTKRIKTLLPVRKPTTCTCNASSGRRSRRRRPRAHSAECQRKRRGFHGRGCPEKRIRHINTERMRRVELRDAFEELRLLVPQVEDKNHSTKVVILGEAAAYCQWLKDEQKKHQVEMDKLLQKQARLLGRVTKLSMQAMRC